MLVATSECFIVFNKAIVERTTFSINKNFLIFSGVALRLLFSMGYAFASNCF